MLFKKCNTNALAKLSSLLNGRGLYGHIQLEVKIILPLFCNFLAMSLYDFIKKYITLPITAFLFKVVGYQIKSMDDNPDPSFKFSQQFQDWDDSLDLFSSFSTNFTCSSKQIFI